jgi:hypothetical protein
MDPSTSDTIGQLGFQYYNERRYGDAITQHQKELRIREKEFGIDHIDSMGQSRLLMMHTTGREGTMTRSVSVKELVELKYGFH